MVERLPRSFAIFTPLNRAIESYMDVSIVIINYHTSQLILNCLQSIYQHTRNVSFEVIIVDNDPPNGGGELVRTAYPEVKWIDMPYNAGFGRANNEGMKIAQGRYFLLLNADTLLIDNVIDRCVERMDQRMDVAACGALQYYPDFTPMPFYRSFNEFRRTFFILPPNRFFQGMLDRLFPEPVYDDPEQYDWLVGAFILVRKEVVEKAGGFDEDFFMYAEDVEWSGRLGKQGKLCYFDDCKFIHLENKNPFRRTNISWINRFSTQMQVSNFAWVRKQYGIGHYLILILHYLSMIPVIYVWKFVINIRKFGNPFAELRTQGIYVRKTFVLLKYFRKTLFLKKGFYKISPSENIDLLTSS
ncbi:glycosyltransferase family 2 protein [Telluribacter sp. SYSU D00476]|uniref:glycosyltransferase family 2 protein n=1 Tax=Telluribacter sp. SYSU D00476 TaxID=2811430 RepID=UPI001FF35BB3|nr:glycosyltransferase [Telluribacter sp. SYSU D00476]